MRKSIGVILSLITFFCATGMEGCDVLPTNVSINKLISGDPNDPEYDLALKTAQEAAEKDKKSQSTADLTAKNPTEESNLETYVVVNEGKVVVSNPVGNIELSAGQAGVADSNQAPPSAIPTTPDIFDNVLTAPAKQEKVTQVSNDICIFR